MLNRLLKNRVTIPILPPLLALLSLLAFAFQGERGIWQPDEGYYTGTAVTMMEKHTVLIPYLGEDQIFLDKPPMIYWGIIAGLKIFGHSEFSIRFFHGLCFVTTALAVGGLSYSMFRDKGLAMLSSLVYATMVIPFIAANFVTPDTLLTMWTTLAALCFWNSVTTQAGRRIIWQMLLCAMVGFGFLAKGPAVLIPCGAMFVFLLIRREWSRYFFTRWSLLGILVFLITGLSWYFWIGLKIPGAFSYFVDNQITGRLITEKYNRNPGIAGAFIYLPVLVFGSLPWSAIWLAKSPMTKFPAFNPKWWKDLPQKPERLFLVCYFFFPLALLCLASSKLGLYALPIFTPLAIATAKLWMKKTQRMDNAPLGDILRFHARPVKLVSCWVFLLLVSRLALAYYPTRDNMKTAWEQIEPYLPSGGYELCTVDRRADGLLFYGAPIVEHLTNKSRPYPTFTGTETIAEEIQDFITNNENGFFLLSENNEITKVLDFLSKSGIQYRMVHLPCERALVSPIWTAKS